MSAPVNPDHGPSRRIILASILLRQGEDPREVADLTGVPMALLTLAPDPLTQQQPVDGTAEPTPIRRRRARLMIVEIGAFINITVCMLALARPSTTLTALTATGALVLTGTVWRCARATHANAPRPARLGQNWIRNLGRNRP